MASKFKSIIRRGINLEEGPAGITGYGTEVLGYISSVSTHQANTRHIHGNVRGYRDNEGQYTTVSLTVHLFSSVLDDQSDSILLSSTTHLDGESQEFFNLPGRLSCICL